MTAYLGTNGSGTYHVVTEANGRGVKALCGIVCNSYGTPIYNGGGPAMCPLCQRNAERNGLLSATTQE